MISELVCEPPKSETKNYDSPSVQLLLGKSSKRFPVFIFENIRNQGAIKESILNYLAILFPWELLPKELSHIELSPEPEVKYHKLSQDSDSS